MTQEKREKTKEKRHNKSKKIFQDDIKDSHTKIEKKE